MKYLWAAIITLWLVAAVYFYIDFVLFHRYFGKAGQKRIVASQSGETKSDYERVNIIAADERILTAKLFSPEKGDGVKSVLLCHGYRSNGEKDFEKEIEYYKTSGYNILVIDQRCHGRSGGDITSLGMVESYDAVYWCKWLELRFGTGCPIVVHGKEMGGFAALACLANPELPQNVEKAIVENVFDCVYDEFSTRMDNKYGFLKKMIVPVVNMFYRHNTGFDMRDAHLKRFVKKVAVPVLFVDTDENLFAVKNTKTAVLGIDFKEYLEK